MYRKLRRASKSDDDDKDGYMFNELPANVQNKLRHASRADDGDNDDHMFNKLPANVHNELRCASKSDDGGNDGVVFIEISNMTPRRGYQKKKKTQKETDAI